MLTMGQVIAEHTDLSEEETSYLGRLVDQWELLSDLSFSDLILWVPDADPNVMWAAAQTRPTTGPTALADDIVGEEISYEPDHLVSEAAMTQDVCSMSDNALSAGIPVDIHAVPVVRNGRTIAVVEMHTNRMGVRAPGILDDMYLDVAQILRDMLFRGDFPYRGDPPVPWVSPRVGDGAVRVDAAGLVSVATPNAVSAFRRMGLTGDMFGDDFAELCNALVRRRQPSELHLAERLAAPMPSEADLESRAAVVRLRFQPLMCEGRSVGSLVLCRDNTELVTRERQLVTKDATIREIHHRVKNNLQTVASLLRLQARRTQSQEARDALNDSMQRIAAISVVHELLSQAFDQSVSFDDVADRLMTMVRDVASSSARVSMTRQGSFSHVPAEVATNLALVLTEVCQNAIEHGIQDGPGTVVVRARQELGRLIVEVQNDGTPLPDTFDLRQAMSLGLSIASTLVEDLGGSFGMFPIPEGTVARISIPMG